jgi:hypothetical protein
MMHGNTKLKFCPKHVEQIISAINHSVASSWFSSLRMYYDAQTNIHQILPEKLTGSQLFKKFPAFYET